MGLQISRDFQSGEYQRTPFYTATCAFEKTKGPVK